MPTEPTNTTGQQHSTPHARRLPEAEQTLQAICRGEVDSLVVRTRDGNRLYSLRPVDVLYRVFFEELPHGAATLAPDGTILYCNPRLAAMLEMSVERLTGATWTTFVAEPDRAAVARMLGLPPGERYEAELTLLAGSGTRVPVSAAASSFCAEETPLLCLLLTDITERRRGQAASRLLAAIVDSSEDAILTKTREGIITSWNHGAELLYGYTAEEVIGQSFQLLVPDDRKRETKHLLARVLAGQPIKHYETVRVRKDRSRIDVSVTLSPLHGPDGAILGVSAIARDITERKRAATALQQTAEELSAANEELRCNVEELTMARQLVEEQQQVYQDLFVFAPSGYLVTDPLGVIQRANEGAGQLLQLSPAELQGLPLASFVAPQEAAAYYARLAELKNGPPDRIQDWEVTIRAGKAKGVTFPVSISVTALRGPDRRLTGLRWLLADIRERKQAEAALRLERDRFHMIVESVPGGIVAFQMSPEGKAWYPFASDRFVELAGLSREILARDATPLLKLIHDDDYGPLMEAVTESARKLSPFRQEFRFKHPIKGQVWYEVRSLPARQQDGSVLWYGITFDITEHKRREEELHKIAWLLSGDERSPRTRAEYDQPYGDLVQLNTCRLLADTVGVETLRNLTHNTMDVLETSAAIYEKNGDYALGIFSSGWCRFMDQASRNLCNTSDNRAALACGQWTCHESCWDTSRKAIETGQPVDVECQGGIRLYAVPVRRGNEIVGSMNFGYGDPPTDPQKLAELAQRYHVTVEELRKAAASYESRPTYLANLAKERLKTSAALVGAILEAKQAKAEADELNRGLELRVRERTVELEAANKELESFSYSVSHDLRAPLRAIDGFSRILQEEHGPNLPADAQDALAEVRSGAQKMGRLIDDLLAFSRLGRRSVSVAVVQPAELVAEVQGLLQPALEGRKVEWSIGALPPCWADRNLLRQVFLNLLDNAVKYTRPRDPARVEIGARAGERPGETVYFVKDNGVGFDMQYAHKLFGVFQRLHSTSEFEGTGVGLALVQRILHKHGGRIWAEAALDQGATFSFALPARGAS